MDTIRLATWINAPVERCFQLSLSIDLHIAAAGSTHEQAVDGVTTGPIAEGETVTFRGGYLGSRRSHTSRVEVLRPFSYFREVMTAGWFRHFEHDHHFAPMDDGTRIRDEIRFSAPSGLLGSLLTRFYLRRHLVRMLTERNALLKRVAETGEWREYLQDRQAVTKTVTVKNRKIGDWDKSGQLRESRS